ncbi:unnamed protein product [Caretta caretta]
MLALLSAKPGYGSAPLSGGLRYAAVNSSVRTRPQVLDSGVREAVTAIFHCNLRPLLLVLSAATTENSRAPSTLKPPSGRRKLNAAKLKNSWIKLPGQSDLWTWNLKCRPRSPRSCHTNNAEQRRVACVQVPLPPLLCCHVVPDLCLGAPGQQPLGNSRLLCRAGAGREHGSGARELSCCGVSRLVGVL